jgi:hypothetical protein
MQITGRRIFSAIMLLGCVVTSYQLFSKPQPVASPQNVEVTRANAASFDQKLERLETPRTVADTPAEVHFSSDEVSAEIAQSTSSPAGSGPASTSSSSRSAAAADPAKPVSTPRSSPDAVVGTGQVQVKGYEVKLEGDVARGQFVTQIAGKDVYVTLAGHLGSQDGYVTFDLTEFKVGDLSIPVSLVSSALQKKLAEQREQLKLPQGIASMRIENSELVITQK